jgi:hypothetical protein
MRDPVGKSSKTGSKPVAKVSPPAPKKSPAPTTASKSSPKSTAKTETTATRSPKLPAKPVKSVKPGKPDKQAETKKPKNSDKKLSSGAATSGSGSSAKGAVKPESAKPKPEAVKTKAAKTEVTKTEVTKKVSASGNTVTPKKVGSKAEPIAEKSTAGSSESRVPSKRASQPAIPVTKPVAGSASSEKSLKSKPASRQQISKPAPPAVKSDAGSSIQKAAIPKRPDAVPVEKNGEVTPKPVASETPRPVKSTKSTPSGTGKSGIGKSGIGKSGIGKKGEAPSSVGSRLHSTPVPVQPPVITVESHHRQPSAVALKVFEQAVKVFNRRQFSEAKTLFENLIAKYPQEVEILARVSTYVHVCNQRLAQSENLPQSADELYDRGVFALNTGNFRAAREFFEKALQARPNEAHLLYSLAVTVLRLGSIDEALGYLKRSFDLQPRFRAQALNDSDFADLREERKFLNLLGMTSPFDRFDSKR